MLLARYIRTAKRSHGPVAERFAEREVANKFETHGSWLGAWPRYHCLNRVDIHDATLSGWPPYYCPVTSVSTGLPDVTWRASLSNPERSAVVESAISTYSSGYIYGFTDGQSATLVASHSPFNADAWRILDQGYSSGEVKFLHPYDFYAIAVTRFYGMQGGRSKIPLYLVIACLADTPGLVATAWRTDGSTTSIKAGNFPFMDAPCEKIRATMAKSESRCWVEVDSLREMARRPRSDPLNR